MNVYLEFSCSSAQEDLADAKRHLIALLAKKRQAQREVEQLEARITEFTGHTKEALDLGEESLALEIAEKIASMESEHKILEQSNRTFYLQVDRLQEAYQGLARRIKLQGLSVTMDYLNAMEELEQGAQDRQLEEKMRAAGIGKNISDGKDVLERIKRR